MPLRSIEWLNGVIRIINQNKLTEKLVYEDLRELSEVVKAIREMKVRGAPLIGVTAALGLALIAWKYMNSPKDKLLAELLSARKVIESTRPTAINLFWSMEKVLEGIEECDEPAKTVIERALKLLREDVENNRRIGLNGLELIEDGDVVLTHCNTGSLATVSIGTALGVIFAAHQRGLKIKVYVTETRPRLQGSKLTMFELKMEGIDSILIPDSAVGYLMSKKLVKKVIVGADRILRDGTTYNKIGTYQIAVLAKHHGIPLYVAAPTSTFDLKSNRSDVKVEERDWREVTHIDGVRVAPEGIQVYNPAFDETPPELISAIITEKGVIYSPYTQSIKKLFK